MGILKKEPAYPFSGFSGQMLFEGEPAVNAKITRTYKLLNDEYDESVVTDQSGTFSFESIMVKYKAPLLAPVEFSSHQEIFVEYNNEKHQIWGIAKGSKEEFSEFGGKPTNFRCELTEDIRTVEIGIGFIGTNCHWDVK